MHRWKQIGFRCAVEWALSGQNGRPNVCGGTEVPRIIPSKYIFNVWSQYFGGPGYAGFVRKGLVGLRFIGKGLATGSAGERAL
jgi:hypothetical protein